MIIDDDSGIVIICVVGDVMIDIMERHPTPYRLPRLYNTTSHRDIAYFLYIVSLSP